MKLIFLVIDGVLNSANVKEPYVSDMEVEKLKLLKKLIDDSGSSGVIITSDRRYSKVDMEDKTEAFDQLRFLSLEKQEDLTKKIWKIIEENRLWITYHLQKKISIG